MNEHNDEPKVWGWSVDMRRLLAAGVLVAALALLGRQAPTRKALDLPVLRADINRAPMAVLLALPEIGPARAADLIEARREARFKDADDVERRVKGIGPRTMAQLGPYLRFGAFNPPGRVTVPTQP